MSRSILSILVFIFSTAAAVVTANTKPEFQYRKTVIAWDVSGNDETKSLVREIDQCFRNKISSSADIIAAEARFTPDAWISIKLSEVMDQENAVSIVGISISSYLSPMAGMTLENGRQLAQRLKSLNLPKVADDRPQKFKQNTDPLSLRYIIYEGVDILPLVNLKDQINHVCDYMNEIATELIVPRVQDFQKYEFESIGGSATPRLVNK